MNRESFLKKLKEITRPTLECPTCDKRARIDKRSLDSGQVADLRVLLAHNDEHPGEFVHMASLLGDVKDGNRGNVAALMRHWALIESQDNGFFALDPKAMYRITDFGRAFLAGDETVPKYIYTYNKKMVAMSDEQNPFVEGNVWIKVTDVKGFDRDDL